MIKINSLNKPDNKENKQNKETQKRSRERGHTIRLDGWPDLYVLTTTTEMDRKYTTDDKSCDLPTLC